MMMMISAAIIATDHTAGINETIHAMRLVHELLILPH